MSREGSRRDAGELRRSAPGVLRGGDVTADDEEDATIYTVVVNDEEQYSSGRITRRSRRGWRSAGMEARKAECLRHIDEVWTDMRPRSLRRKMETGSRDSDASTESDGDPSPS